MAKLSLRCCMINMIFLVEDSSRTREFLMKICLVYPSMINDWNHLRIIETEMIGSNSNDGALVVTISCGSLRAFLAAAMGIGLTYHTSGEALDTMALLYVSTRPRIGRMMS